MTIPRFKHRAVGPRKGTGSVFIGKVSPRVKLTRQQKAAQQAMRNYQADATVFTLGSLVDAKGKDR